jgi:uncharacterized membrane protein
VELARLLHVLGAVVWVGGMFFAYMALRPAAATLLEPPQRLPLWRETFRRFFFWVWLSVAAVLGSGLWMIALFGGFGAVGLHVHVMLALGVVMMLIFGHVYFSPYRRLTRLVAEKSWKPAGEALGQIRKLVALNLTLGLLTIAVGTAGRLFPVSSF